MPYKDLDKRKSFHKEYGARWYIENKDKHLTRSRNRHRANSKSKKTIWKEEGLRSSLERSVSIQLKNAGIAYEYESMEIPYTIHHHYKPDFILENGIIIEAKGQLNRKDRGESRKMIAVKKEHPHLDIRFVFQNAQGPIAYQKQTHAAWADKYGFPWADGEIPEEWLKKNV